MQNIRSLDISLRPYIMPPLTDVGSDSKPNLAFQGQNVEGYSLNMMLSVDPMPT
jgi:hypothetical protein